MTKKNYPDWRESWVDILAGKHPNSCRQQIVQNCQLAAFYGTVNEMGKRGSQDLPVNGQLMHMFVLGYVIRQANAIRRLVDRSKDVMSLGRVVLEMTDNHVLLSRSNLVGFDGTPVDTDAARQAYVQTVDVEQAIHNSSASGDSMLLQRWIDSDRRNKAFDRIAEMSSGGKRSDDDLVSISVLQKFADELKSPAIKRIKKFVDKLIAHADDSIDLSDPTVAISMADLKNSLRHIAQLQAFLLGPVLQHSSGRLVPVPQFDHLADLDKPLVPASQMQAAHQIWSEVANEIDAWTNGNDCFSQFYVDK